MNLVLRREKTQPSNDCTLGLLFIPGVLSLVTIERPWIPSPTCKGGMKGKSCVPVGVYDLVQHDSPKHPRTWALVNHDLDVVHYEGDDHDPDEDRATCLLHGARIVQHVIGCIGVGCSTIKGAAGYELTNPRKAMDMLREKLPWQRHTIEISEAT
jgi:hypothetical protein